MCSWCWGYRPAWSWLKTALPADIEVVNVLGGLAPDTDAPMPESMRQAICSHWKRIHTLLGTEFNFDFWTRCQPRRDTYKSCRAVVVAASMGKEEEMILAIQQAYYLRALNPSDSEVLVQLAAELGLDRDDFAAELISAATQSALQRQLALRDRLGVNSFPSLVLSLNGQRKRIAHDYHDPGKSLQTIHSLLAAVRS
jgi:putative protein-disulfide isomerase